MNTIRFRRDVRRGRPGYRLIAWCILGSAALALVGSAFGLWGWQKDA